MIRRVGVLAFLLGVGSAFAQADPPPVQSVAKVDRANSRLKVSFFWPFRADYWIVGLDDDYRWAVVGNPDRKYLWVLSRTPQLAGEQLDRALRAAKAQGFDLARLRFTSHGQSGTSR